MSSTDLTVVLPIYNEEENLRPLIKELVESLSRPFPNFEIIAVDDASTDASLEVLKTLAQEFSQIRIYSFRGNRGQSAAFDAGFRMAKGKLVVTMDSDGQNDPADIPKLIEHMNKGYDFVTGFREKRQDGLFLRKIPSKIANWLIRNVTKTKVRDLGCSLKAYRSEITQDLLLYGEMHRFISVLVELQGARVGEIAVNHRPRLRGQSKYNLSRTIKVLFDLMTVWFFRNYHTKPIYVFGGLSLVSFTASFFISLFVLFEKYFHDIYVHRNPLFMIASVLALVGVQFLVLGLLAEIMIRTYFESQNKRPYSFKFIQDRS